MAKNNMKLFGCPWIKYTAMSLLFLFLWFALTVWYIVIFDQSLLVLSTPHNASNFTRITHNKLIKGDKLAGEFVATDNNLGIVALRFKTFPRVQYKDEDSLVFRLKEKGQKNWYYENKYRSGFTYDMPFLPFGFPVIHDSKGKTYVFELESLKGNEHNGVALSSRQPFLVSKYQANKAALLSDKKALLLFGFKKFFNSFLTIDVSYSSFVFAFALLFYLFFISPLKRFLSKYVLPVFILITVLFNVLFLQILNDPLMVFIAILWFCLMKEYKFESKYSYYVGGIFFIVMILAYYLNNVAITQQAGSFAFIFFVVATVLALVEVKRDV